MGVVACVDVAKAWDPVQGYLNTAAVGLPPRVAVSTLQDRVVEWRDGACDPQSFDVDVERSRSAFARITGVDADAVGVVGQVSVVSSLVASSLPAGSVVLCAREDFTSTLFPFLGDLRLNVRIVPLAELLDALTTEIDLVAVSAVQSSDGRVIDLDALAALAGEVGARTYVDVTHAAGWLDVGAGRFDVTACHAYKWLCSPRGAAFLTVSESARQWVAPIYAGWYSSDDPWGSIYGPPLRLAETARRYDASPAWFSYAAAAPTLELLADLGTELISSVSVGLANEFRHLVGLPPAPSPIVSVSSRSVDALPNVGVVAATRAGRARLSFFIYNTRDDARQAAEVLHPVLEAEADQRS